MAQPVDFVGLNTFIYEVIGFDPENQISISDGQLSKELKQRADDGTNINLSVQLNTFGQLPVIGPSDANKRNWLGRVYKNFLFPLVLPETASFFHALLLRDGPYGYSTWKQIRVGDNRLTKRQRENSIITTLDYPNEINMVLDSGRTQRVLPRFGEIKLFRESPVVTRYHPLSWNVGNQVEINGETIIRRFSAVSSLGNDTEFMANEDLNEILGLATAEENENYSLLKSYYLDGQLEAVDSPIDAFEFLRYRETIYPREVNMYRAEVRNRTTFSFPWNSDRSLRDETDVVRFNTNVPSQSFWPMDADTDWETRSVPTNIGTMRAGGEDENNSVGSPGLLQNSYSQYAQAYGGTVNPDTHFTASAYYARRHDFSGSASLISPEGLVIPDSGSTDINQFHLFEGSAKYQTGEQAGFFEGTSSVFTLRSKQPFFNSYDFYAENVRTKGQGYTLIPEFRMSQHVADFEVSNDPNDNLDTFEITGAHSSLKRDSSQDNFYETYSNTEFLKHFKLIKGDHEDFARPSKIKLVCKAVKKFLPYEGFYPAQRTAQIAEQFWDSYAENFSLSSSVNGTSGGGRGTAPTSITWDVSSKAAGQAILQPLFAPGILFNSIKSGVAVDYPMYMNTASLEAAKDEFHAHIFRATSSSDATPFDERIRFETLAFPATQLANKDIPLNENHPSSSHTSSCLWSGQGDNLYVKMVNNFLAEVPRFFLENQQTTIIESLPQGNPNFGKVTQGAVKAGAYYGMRIKMRKSLDGPTAFFNSGSNYPEFSAPQVPEFYADNSSVSTKETFTMYSRPSAFGPNTAFRPNAGFALIGSQNGFNWPYTPPYYHGDAWLDLYFKPTENKKYSVHEIISSLTASYKRYWQRSFDAETLVRFNDYAMQLSASINFTNTGEKKFVADQDAGEVTSVIVDAVDQNNARWVIQPKWECPMLNFNHLSGGASANPFGTSGNFSIIASSSYGNEQASRGMWHQYGRIPQDSSTGVFLEVTDIPDPWPSIESITDPVFSLADLCGFQKTPQRLGECADRKIVKEAVVAVPFLAVDSEKKFFRIPRSIIQSAQGVKAPIPLPEAGDSIVDMVNKMKDYVFPPSMDFLNDSEIEPFSMYIFEFKHELSKLDLADIWQNLPPEIGETLDVAESSIEHDLLSRELLDESLSDSIRWMVFKVKQKAETSYFSTQAGKSNTALANLVTGKTAGITFNWPYDFFSLVELVRLDAEIDFADSTESGELVPKAKKKKKDTPKAFEPKAKKSTVKKKRKR